MVPFETLLQALQEAADKLSLAGEQDASWAVVAARQELRFMWFRLNPTPPPAPPTEKPAEE
jgi:hypothetical protein